MFDFNVKYRGLNTKGKHSMVKRMYELGYSCIAWNVHIIGKINSVANQTKPIPEVNLTPIDIKESLGTRLLVAPTKTTNQLKQLNRLTVTIDELADAQSLTTGNEYLRKFDIIAASPGNAKVFEYLCKTAEIDLISIDFTRRIPFSINKKLVTNS